MDKKIWRQNNPSLQKLENNNLSDEEFAKLIQADVNSQLTWIMVRSCKGIRCKECYIKKYCTTKNVKDSQSLAGAIIKSAINKNDK